MKETPILFKGPLVRAILYGRKTVTRRVLKLADDEVYYFDPEAGVHFGVKDGGLDDHRNVRAIPCPYGGVTQHLWVKETWRPHFVDGGGMSPDSADVVVRYEADGRKRFFSERVIPDDWTLPKAARTGNVTPLFMPRWASRITLEITSVRVERLHDITEEDARAEGVERSNDERWPWRNYDPLDGAPFVHATTSFQSLWTSINGAESWDANPLVWRLAFRRVDP